MLFGPDQNHMSDNLVAETTEFWCRRVFPGNIEITSMDVYSGNPCLQTTIHEFQANAQSSFLSMHVFVVVSLGGFFAFLPYSLLKWFLFCFVANSAYYPLLHRVSMMLSIKSS